MAGNSLTSLCHRGRCQQKKWLQAIAHEVHRDDDEVRLRPMHSVEEAATVGCYLRTEVGERGGTFTIPL